MASMPEMLKTISPVDGRVYAERPLAAEAEIAAALDRAVAGQRAWRRTSLAERPAQLSRPVDTFVADEPDLHQALTWQMDRPLSQQPGALRGCTDQDPYMYQAAQDGTAPV